MAQKLFVGNLSYSTTEEAVMALFSEYGEVASVTIVTDRETGRSRGFAFVEMATDEGAQAAIDALNESRIDGRAILVDRARPKADRFGGGGGGGGGGNRRGERRPRY